MSIAEFYIENGLNEHYGIDDWLRDQNDSLDGFGVGRVNGDRHGGSSRAGKDASGRGGGKQRGYQFKCPACAKLFVSAGSVADHYKNKQDEPHRAYRAKHGNTISGDENKISSTAAGASSSSSGAGSKRPMPDSSAPSKRRALETMDGGQVFESGLALVQELRQILCLPQLEYPMRDVLRREIAELVEDAGDNGDYSDGGYAGFSGGGRVRARDWSQRMSQVELARGRFGAILRGDYIITVGEVLFGGEPRQPYHIDSNCAVTVVWKDDMGELHADHEKADRGELRHFIDDVIATNFDPVAAQLDFDYEFESGEGAHLEPSAQDLPNGIVDKRVWRLSNRVDAIATLWQAVREYIEAERAGRLPLPPAQMPPCLHTFLSGARPGRLFDLSSGYAPETLLADDALHPGPRCRWGFACPHVGDGCREVHSVQEIDLAAQCGLTAALRQLGGAWGPAVAAT